MKYPLSADSSFSAPSSIVEESASVVVTADTGDGGGTDAKVIAEAEAEAEADAERVAGREAGDGETVSEGMTEAGDLGARRLD